MKPKPTLVLIPGWGSTCQVWGAIEPALSLHFNILHVELMSPTLLSGDDSSEALVKHIAEQIPEKSVVLAWSLGGMLAAKVASAFKQKVSRLVVIATNISFVERRYWKHAMLTDVFSGFVDSYQKLPQKTQKRFLGLQTQGESNAKKIARELQRFASLTEENHKHALSLLKILGELSLYDDLASVNIPVLFLFGENDALVPSVAAESLRELALANGWHNIQATKMSGAHAPHVSHPEQCLIHVFDFLKLVDRRYWKDKKKVALAFSKAAPNYDNYAFLQRDVAQDLINLAAGPDTGIGGVVADLGCGTGYCMQLMQSNKDINTFVGVDIAHKMLSTARGKTFENDVHPHFVGADIERLPLRAGSIDWAVSSLAVQWCENLESIFEQVHGALAETGLFLLSVLGEETLHELKYAWAEADPSHVHVNQFFSIEQVISAAEETGFEMQVFESSKKTVEYNTVLELMRDLKGIGAHNMNNGNNKGLTGKATLKKLGEAYECYRNDRKKIPATYDVQYWLLSKRRII